MYDVRPWREPGSAAIVGCLLIIAIPGDNTVRISAVVCRASYNRRGAHDRGEGFAVG